MSQHDTMQKTIHHGRNVKRFREMLGIKQEAFAAELGEDWSQRRVSLLEQKEEIEEGILAEVAKVLKVPVEAIKNFDEEKAIYNIQNNYGGSTLNHSSNYLYNHQPNFNPLDKVVELYESKIQLYERMLKDKEEMIKRLESLVKS